MPALYCRVGLTTKWTNIILFPAPVFCPIDTYVRVFAFHRPGPLAFVVIITDLHLHTCGRVSYIQVPKLKDPVAIADFEALDIRVG